jgi:predicted anti-sigma-YlaC factor YlaD
MRPAPPARARRGLIEGSTSTPIRIVARGTCLATQLLLCTWLAGCASVHHYATERLGDAMASGGSGFSGDDDPELIRAAAPFSLKLMESLLQETPQHAGLLTATAAGFTEYAYAFVQEDADELEAHDVAASLELRRRAHGLYLRARDYGMRALETRHANFGARLRHSSAAAAAELDQRDAPAIYWTAASWAASISLDKDSPDALADLPLVAALLGRLQTLDADYDHGALDALLMSYESGRPGARDPQTQVRHHFERAVRLSEGQKAGPYVAFAETVCVQTQDRGEFVATLQQALAIDPTLRPQWRLENRVMQRRARWLLTQTDQLFLE